MANYKSNLLMSNFVTHDVKRFVLEKPQNYKFTPGQATDVAIDKDGLRDKKHPFTFTSLDEDKVLEFTIKGYPTDKHPDHEGVTEELHILKPGDTLILDDPWGTIKYKGIGVFIAGGAGITPFLAIFRDLVAQNKLKGNKLMFSNKQRQDIILEKELRNYFEDKDLILTLTKEKYSNLESGRINKEMLKKYVTNFNQAFYVCGPKGMVADVKKYLAELGAETESVVFEE